MKPFELSMDFLLKSRENRALIESLLDRMEGAELNLDEIDAQNELRDWNRAAHINEILSNPLGSSQGARRRARKRKSKYDPLEVQYPSLRHMREQKEYYQPTETELRMQEIRDNEKRRRKQGEDEYREHILGLHGPIEQQMKNAIARFKLSDAGQELQESLEEDMRNRKIANITGVPTPEKQQKRPTSTEENFLLHALRTGDSSILDRYQTKTDNPLIGDLSLQDFERFYPTEMSSQQGNSVAVEQPLSTFDKISQEYHDEMNERYPSSTQQSRDDFLATLPENQKDWTDEETKRYMSSLFG